MTDEELIAGMRARKDAGSKLAADRIEALSAERDRWKDACRSASRDLNIVVPDNDRLKSERDAAEAKLAKAVGLLILCRDMFDEVAHPSDPLSVMLNETIAEIKSGVATTPYGLEGESHD